MSTSLHFEAPADLSVGRVRIEGEGGTLADWIATPNNRSFNIENADPGIYLAQIEPAGVRAQTVIFEVKSGISNTVFIPDFADLSVDGSTPRLLDIEDHPAAVEALRNVVGQDEAPTDRAPSEAVPLEMPKPVKTAETRKRLTVALAEEEEGGGRESWRPFRGNVAVELVAGRLDLLVTAAQDWSAAQGQRVRLSVALERVCVERLLLPMYRGGTMVSLTPSQLATGDVTLEITPHDPELRALYRALSAGTPAEAEAVRSAILSEGGMSRYFEGETADPWGALLTGLLDLRFPDLFGASKDGWTERLVREIGWAYDSWVIHARHLLTSAGKDPAERRQATADAVAALTKAQALGAPYYVYSNQLIGETLGALCMLTGIDRSAEKKAKRAFTRWQRDLALQSAAGAAFAWRRQDPAQLAQGMLAPDRSPTGTLSRRNGSIVFRGRVELGQIGLDTTARAAPKSRVTTEQSSVCPAEMQGVTETDPGHQTRIPALTLPVANPEDPNKGRFGDTASVGAYSLGANFRETNSENWVVVDIFVEADDSRPPPTGETVFFCLHPTFQPQVVKARFRGRRAHISLKAWGGFTVGAWLPGENVELECDLAKLPDAPRIVREL